jgi:two-component system chemotaxis response regulator CheB
VVFGMPKEAIKLGGAGKVVPLDKIPQEIVSYGA